MGFVVALLFSGLVTDACADAADDAARKARTAEIITKLKANESQDQILLMSGRKAEVVARFRDAGKSGDALTHWVVGNLLWRIDPDAAYDAHIAALKLLPEEPTVLIEMALEYTRRDQCVEANALFDKLDDSTGLKSPLSAVAAYCLFKTGKIAEGKKLWQRSDVIRQHIAVEKLLHSVFGDVPFPAHNADYLAASKGDRAAFDRLLHRAYSWPFDWWNNRRHAIAAEAAFELMTKVLPANDPFAAGWNCMRAELDSGTRKLGLDALSKCKLLVGDHPFPGSSGLGKLLLGSLLSGSPEMAPALLEKHRSELTKRANSAAGDLFALECLAALQANARDAPGLAVSDELGWTRYGKVEFALSRLSGLATQQPISEPELLAAIDRARQDFPSDPRVLEIIAGILPADDPKKEAATVALILAEFRSLLIGGPNIRSLDLQIRGLPASP